jgi:hypothetical protein
MVNKNVFTVGLCGVEGSVNWVFKKVLFRFWKGQYSVEKLNHEPPFSP